VSYGTADRDTGDRVYFDPIACVIRAGETGLSRSCRERKLGRKKKREVKKR